jgi:hypothetical protein
MSSAIVRIWRSRRQTHPDGYTAELKLIKDSKYALRYISIYDDCSLKDFLYVLFEDYERVTLINDRRRRV